MKKRLILVGAPAGCGKSYLSRRLAALVSPCVYLDLDSLNPLSQRLCQVAGEAFDKGGDFFRANGRDAEYEALFTLAAEALCYSDIVILSAPFTKELRDPGRFAWVREMAAEVGAGVLPVWVLCSPEACRRNMEERAAPRDAWKLADPEGYLAGIRLEPPEGIPGLFVLDNRRRGEQGEALEALKRMLRPSQQG